MTARQIASVLSDIQTYLELTGADDFRTKAYARAARALETTQVDIDAAAANGTLTSIPGIGKAMAAEVLEIIEKGTCAVLEELRASTPPGLIGITRLRGVGGRKVRALHQAIGVASLDELEAACREGRVAGIAGFGAKSQQNILAGIIELRSNDARFRIDTAMVLADALAPRIAELPGVTRVETTGSVRRGAEEFDHVELIAQTASPEAFVAEIATMLGDIRSEDGAICGMLEERYEIRIHTADAASFVPRWHRTTGPEEYLATNPLALDARTIELRGDVVYRDGAPIVLEREEELYALGGGPYVPPELRDEFGDAPRALDGSIPPLVDASRMLGVLHVHSTWSDGKRPIAEIAEHARSRGYRYLLMCDHSKLAFYANGLDEIRLEAQGREIDELNARYDPSEFRILKGIECDILADGALDLADDALASLDAVVVSVHSRFELEREAQTERICRALEHRYTTILGHATGRLILRRKGYDVDLERVIETAARTGRSIEINGNPHRLDLAWRYARSAGELGVPIAINPDAHSLEDFENVRYGLVMARKAGLGPEAIVNTKTAEEFLAWAAGLRS